MSSPACAECENLPKTLFAMQVSLQWPEMRILYANRCRDSYRVSVAAANGARIPSTKCFRFKEVRTASGLCRLRNGPDESDDSIAGLAAGQRGNMCSIRDCKLTWFMRLALSALLSRCEDAEVNVQFICSKTLIEMNSNGREHYTTSLVRTRRSMVIPSCRHFRLNI